MVPNAPLRPKALLILLPLSFVSWPATGAAQTSPAVTLAGALERARQHYEQFQIIEEQRVQVELARDRAWAALLPNLSVRGTFTLADKEVNISGRVLQRYDTFGGTGTASLVLFDGRAIPDLLSAYDQVAGAAELSRWQQNELAFVVAEAFFGAFAADSLVEANLRSLNAADEQLAAARRRIAAGMAIALDETRFELDVVEARESLIYAENVRASSYDLLAFYMGESQPVRLAPAATVGVPERDTTARTVQALAARPDLKAADYTVSAAETAVTGAWMDYLPSLSVSGNFRASQNTGWSGVPYSGNMVVSLDWVLFDGGLRCVERRARDSELRVTRLERALLERSVRREVRQAWRDLITVRATLTTAHERNRLAHETATAVGRRYDAGLATSLDVTEAEEDLSRAGYNLILGELNLSLAGLAVLRALGLDPQGEAIGSHDER